MLDGLRAADPVTTLFGPLETFGFWIMFCPAADSLEFWTMAFLPAPDGPARLGWLPFIDIPPMFCLWTPPEGLGTYGCPEGFLLFCMMGYLELAEAFG